MVSRFTPHKLAVAALAATFAGTGLVATAHAALVGLYRFNNTNNFGADSSGNGNNLTLQGTTTDVTQNATGGAFAGDGAAAFNGSGGFFSTATGTTPADFPIGNNSYTVVAFVQPSSDATYGTLLGPTNAQEGILGYGNYGFPATNQGGTTNAFRLAAPNGVDNYYFGNDTTGQAATGVNLTDGNYHEVAATYDGSTDTRTVYIDGTQVAQSVLANGLAETGNNFTLGLTNGAEYFYGNLSDVAVYNQALSQTQLAAIQSTGVFSTPSVPEPATLAIAVVGVAALGLRRRRRLAH